MIYHFGAYAFDGTGRQLRCRGRDVSLQPKVMSLLEVLLHQRGRIVPREVLLRALWPDAIVTEASLTRLVKELRRALGDDGRKQRAIQTVHTRGYRFVAVVRIENGDGPRSELRSIELARESLEAALDLGARDLRARVQDFTNACMIAIRNADGVSGSGR